jgi:cytochrome c
LTEKNKLEYDLPLAFWRKLMKILGLFFALSIFALAAPAFADGDAEAGKVVFRKCAVCHAVVADKTGVGPTMHGIIGRKSASVPRFAYSNAMKAYDVTWTEETLFTYLEKPQTLVKGTKMVFPGLPSEKERRDVIAYMATLK